ncbi:MAG: FAD:protein FMN transferase, partial [Phycisphaerae bacterium]
MVIGRGRYRRVIPGILCVLLGHAGVSRAAAPGSTTAPQTSEYEYHRTEVLGTSLDLIVIAPEQASADLAAETIFKEIERLRLILSTYDPKSEISGVNAGTQPTKVAPELIEVLQTYETWTRQTHGACSGQMGELVQLWAQAEKVQQLPEESALKALVTRLGEPGWKIEAATNTVTRLPGQVINVNSLGKGYIIGKAIQAARAKVPAVTGLLLNIGGDMMASGSAAPKQQVPWRIGVADPNHHAENDPRLAQLKLNDLAVATSGAYERSYEIKGKKYSHILDPRTGRPAQGVLSATVIAPSAFEAEVAAKAILLSGSEAGLEWLEEQPDYAAVIVREDGRA